jgi:hypothetical protein
MRYFAILLLTFSWAINMAQDPAITDPEVIPPMGDKIKLFGVKPAEKSEYRLDQDFYFNKKIYFTAKTREVQLSSYFYLNTKNGMTGYDIDVARQLGKDYTNMEFAIKLDDGNIFMYQRYPKTNEKIASIVREGPGFLPQYLEDATSVEYFKDYMERTGEKTTVGDKSQYISVRYQGVNMEGGHMFALMSDNAGFNMNPDNKLLILSFFGLGYIWFEGKTKLITGWESDDYVARLERIEDTNFFFDGKPYKSFQQKADAEINKFEVSTKSGFSKEKEQIERQEQALNNRSAARSSRPEDVQRQAIDREIVAIKKQILEKKEQLTGSAASKASEVSKKQGDIDVTNKKLHEFMGGNDLLEIMMLESKLEKLDGEKKLLNPAASEKDKVAANQKVNCAQQRMNLIDQIYIEYQAIDSKYPEDEYQRFIQKMNIMNTQLMPAMQTVCK